MPKKLWRRRWRSIKREHMSARRKYQGAWAEAKGGLGRGGLVPEHIGYCSQSRGTRRGGITRPSADSPRDNHPPSVAAGNVAPT